MRTSCQATKRDGEPCRATAVLASGFCTAHDPDYRDQRRASSAKGGRHKSHRERIARSLPSDLQWLAERLAIVFDEIHRGDVKPQVGTALASVAGAIVKVHEIGELQMKLQDIDERLKAAESPDKGA